MRGSGRQRRADAGAVGHEILDQSIHARLASKIFSPSDCWPKTIIVPCTATSGDHNLWEAVNNSFHP